MRGRVKVRLHLRVNFRKFSASSHLSYSRMRYLVDCMHELVDCWRYDKNMAFFWRKVNFPEPAVNIQKSAVNL